MANGLYGSISPLIFGNPPSVQNPGDFFNTGVGKSYKSYLMDLYSKNSTDTNWYKTAASALRDSLDQESRAAAETIGTSLNGSGAYDSGARVASLESLNRAKLFNYSQGLAQIINQIEQARVSAALPYLSARAGASASFNAAKLGQATDQQQRNMFSHLKGIVSVNLGGDIGGGGSSGGGGGF